MEYPQKGGLKILAAVVPELRLTQKGEAPGVQGLKSGSRWTIGTTGV